MRSLNLDQLRAFVEVIERGSFTAAAKELNLTQPAVTHQVQELERRFQVALVERFGKRPHLTEAGEKLIEHARNLLEEDSRTQVMMRRFGDGWLGRVRVGTSMTVLMYLLPPVLRQLKTDHPQLEINLKAGFTTTTLQMLKTNALDLGLCALPIEDPAFETVPLFKDELVAILPAALGHVPKTVTPAFLSRCPQILGSENSALRRMSRAYPWASDTSRRRICWCGRSVRARADGSDWSGCAESRAPMAWISSPPHCWPCGAEAHRPDQHKVRTACSGMTPTARAARSQASNWARLRAKRGLSLSAASAPSS